MTQMGMSREFLLLRQNQSNKTHPKCHLYQTALVYLFFEMSLMSARGELIYFN